MKISILLLVAAFGRAAAAGTNCQLFENPSFEGGTADWWVLFASPEHTKPWAVNQGGYKPTSFFATSPVDGGYSISNGFSVSQWTGPIENSYLICQVVSTPAGTCTIRFTYRLGYNLTGATKNRKVELNLNGGTVFETDYSRKPLEPDTGHLEFTSLPIFFSNASYNFCAIEKISEGDDALVGPGGGDTGFIEFDKFQLFCDGACPQGEGCSFDTGTCQSGPLPVTPPSAALEIIRKNSHIRFRIWRDFVNIQALKELCPDDEVTDREVCLRSVCSVFGPTVDSLKHRCLCGKYRMLSFDWLLCILGLKKWWE